MVVVSKRVEVRGVTVTIMVIQFNVKNTIFNIKSCISASPRAFLGDSDCRNKSL